MPVPETGHARSADLVGRRSLGARQPRHADQADRWRLAALSLGVGAARHWQVITPVLPDSHEGATISRAAIAVRLQTEVAPNERTRAARCQPEGRPAICRSAAGGCASLMGYGTGAPPGQSP